MRRITIWRKMEVILNRYDKIGEAQKDYAICWMFCDILNNHNDDHYIIDFTTQQEHLIFLAISEL